MEPSGLPTLDPTITLETEPFWLAAAEGRLVLPHCDHCGAVIWYPRRFCPTCHRLGVTWVEASGRGEVYSFTIVRKAPGPWTEAVPYVIASIELEEGPRILGNVVGVDVAAVRIAMAVEVVFDPSPGGHGVPRWRPSES